MITKITLRDKIKELIQATLGGNDERHLLCGVYLVSYLLDEATINSHNLGYFLYTSLMGEFSSQAIDSIFEGIHSVCSALLVSYSRRESLDVRLVSESFEAYTKLFNFPFENSYISFNMDIDLSEHTPLNLPPRICARIMDPQFLAAILSFALNESVKEEVRYIVVNFISRATACRVDHTIQLQVELYSNYLRYQMNFASQVLSFYNSRNRFPSGGVVEALVDQIGRLLYIARNGRLGKQREDFRALLQALNVLSKVVCVSNGDVIPVYYSAR